MKKGTNTQIDTHDTIYTLHSGQGREKRKRNRSIIKHEQNRETAEIQYPTEPAFTLMHYPHHPYADDLTEDDASSPHHHHARQRRRSLSSRPLLPFRSPAFPFFAFSFIPCSSPPCHCAAISPQQDPIPGIQPAVKPHASSHQLRRTRCQRSAAKSDARLVGVLE